MKRQAVSLLTVFLLSDACSPSENSAQTAIAQTQAAIPMVTPSEALNLAENNLDPVLFQAGDLPNQYKSGQISYRWAGNLPQPYPPDNVIIQKAGWIISEGFDDDYLLIALFAEENNLLATHEDIVSSIEDKPFEDSNVGEKPRFVFLSTFSGRGFFIFVRC